MEPLDTTSLSLLEGWPKGMYLVEDKDNSIINCGVSGCEHTFKSQNDMKTLVNHYAYPWPGPARFTIEHGIRHQMHTLDTCLECGADFRENRPDARRLFYHVTTQHPLEADISTLQGFLVFMRKYCWRVPIEVPKDKEYQKKTFKLAFDHLKLSLTEGIWADLFKRFMGYAHHQVIPDAVLLQTLTVPGVYEFYPVHPDAFLFYVQYNPDTSLLTPDQWQGIRSTLQGLYSKGSI
ncbi:hypothetical protein JMJ35_003488 [Cladonia borealis]|uniref:Uncharacterized protein n=1 Tax=Cladonia borealis TaxID=184061 RepID=A0AA39R476_9LECA|nr:hypothetical protein JMJ35_003488 [Cladonia borealis]